MLITGDSERFTDRQTLRHIDRHSKHALQQQYWKCKLKIKNEEIENEKWGNRKCIIAKPTRWQTGHAADPASPVIVRNAASASAVVQRNRRIDANEDGIKDAIWLGAVDR